MPLDFPSSGTCKAKYIPITRYLECNITHADHTFCWLTGQSSYIWRLETPTPVIAIVTFLEDTQLDKSAY